MGRGARLRVCLAVAVLIAPLLVALGPFTGRSGFSASPPAQQVSDPPSDTTDPEFDFPSMSADGLFVTYRKTRPLREDLSTLAFVRDRSATTSVLVPQVGGTTTNGVPAISRNGCKVAYWKGIALGGGQFQFRPVVWDRCADPTGQSPATSVVTVNGPILNDGPTSNNRLVAVSADGHFVAAIGNNGVVFRTDMTTGFSIFMPNAPSTANFADGVDISDDGAFLAVTLNLLNASGQSTHSEVWGWRPDSPAAPVPVSVAANNAGVVTVGSEPSVSGDGAFVAFVAATNLNGAGAQFQQLWVRNMSSGAVNLVTDTGGQLMSGNAGSPDMNSAATQIAYSFQPAPPAGAAATPPQAFVAGSTAGFSSPATLDLVSFGVDDKPLTDRGADHPAISSTGRFVAFSSFADRQLGVDPPPSQDPGSTLPGGIDNRKDVWARERPETLTITSPLDFGTVDVGAASAVLPATVTNSSKFSVPLTGLTPPAAPFFVVSDSCSNATLQPSASCVVGLQFRPTSPSPSTGTLVVTADAATVSSSLRGTGRTPGQTTTTTTTTTTVRPGVTTTTTTPPGRGALSIAPATLDFGSTTVGTTVGPQTFVVTNTGTATVAISTGTISGAGGDQFTIVTNACAGRTLAVRTTCTISVRASPTRAGTSQGTLTVSAAGGLSATGTMRIAATFAPTLRVSPGVLRPGDVGEIIGAGFPANTPIQLTLQGGGPVGTPTTDAAGAFRFDLVIFQNDPRIGGKVLVAVDQPGLFLGVRTTFLIELATFTPSGSVTPAITSGIRSLVISRSG